MEFHLHKFSLEFELPWIFMCDRVLRKMDDIPILYYNICVTLIDLMEVTWIKQNPYCLLHLKVVILYDIDEDIFNFLSSRYCQD